MISLHSGDMKMAEVILIWLCLNLMFFKNKKYIYLNKKFKSKKYLNENFFSFNQWQDKLSSYCFKEKQERLRE